MAHNLMQREDGSYAWAGNAPAWHNLGVSVGRALTAAEAIEKAGFDFTVDKIPLVTEDGQETDRYATVRSDKPVGDPDRILGYVTEGYEIVEYADAFAFFDQIVGEDQAIYDSVGILGHGEKMFIVARIPSEFYIKEDQFLEFVTLTSGHDSQHSIQIYLTPVRVVCANTLSMSLRSTQTKVILHHTKNVYNRLLNAAPLIGLMDQKFKEVQELFNALVERPVTHPLFNSYVKTLFPSAREEQDKEPTAPIQGHRNMVHELFESDTNRTPGTEGTWYAAANAAIEYVDHYRPMRAERTRSVLFGSGADFKQRAVDIAWDFSEGKRE